MGSDDQGKEEGDAVPSNRGPSASAPRYQRYQLHWIAVILDAALIFALSSRPRPTDDLPPGSILEAIYEGTPGADKIVHFISFFFFGLLLSLALSGTRPPKGSVSVDRNAVIALLIGVVYAATDEIHQHFVPPRTPDIADFAVDSLGAAVAIILVRWRASKAATGKGAARP